MKTEHELKVVPKMWPLGCETQQTFQWAFHVDKAARRQSGADQSRCVMPAERPRQRGKLDLWPDKDTCNPMKSQLLDPPTISEIIEMALSDHASFDQIRTLHGLGPDEVKALMRQNLKSGSYRAWRRRVRAFADRREVYK